MPDLNIHLPVVVCQTANLRSQPDRNGERLAVLEPGHQATITNGPRVTADLTWWELDSAGWVVESIEGEDILTVAPATDFERAVYFTLQQEGGLSTDSSDAGNWTGGIVGVGKLKGTKYGLSSLSYPDIDVVNLTRSEAIDIYHADYWLAAGCDKLPWPLSACLFDASVNCGIGQATQWLHQCNGDWQWYLDLRRAFYRGLHQFDLYGEGWLRRVDALAALIEENVGSH